jgi:hypothetical protein
VALDPLQKGDHPAVPPCRRSDVLRLAVSIALGGTNFGKSRLGSSGGVALSEAKSLSRPILVECTSFGTLMRLKKL